MKPVSTGVVCPLCVQVTVLVCPPSRSSFSKRWMVWGVLRRVQRVERPDMPLPMIAIRFLSMLKT
jgi:hypothetical protein